jgi:hypothetical protein
MAFQITIEDSWYDSDMNYAFNDTFILRISAGGSNSGGDNTNSACYGAYPLSA